MALLRWSAAVALTLGWLAAAHAEGAPPPLQQETAEQRIATHRAKLLAALQAARTESEARYVASRIWRLWRTGPDIVATGLLLDVDAHVFISEYETAFEILDQITRDYPDWAEGWNARATLYFARRRFDESLADIERTLELEPAHFGALAGRARILFELGQFDEAREAIRQAMIIHPWIPERRLLRQMPQVRDI